MKIVLHAFGNKLKGIMEVPEDTLPRFRLAMTQPIQKAYIDYGRERDLMQQPINTIATFEWTGRMYSEKGHEYDGARIYQLVSFD